MPEITIQYSNQKRKDMNYTISMTDILLAVSVGCNLWFL
ncbi:conjugal transfer protein TraD, partial [Phocaeicola dorei]|nr:conjugal transfer protein TraD [Phocaeicola dorei]MCG4616735.1 conjugal transfer protein TraD [Phocaeicola dorei]MCG4639913.1 conjugal transfer protein TraD [Phocaeicola dorei]